MLFKKKIEQPLEDEVPSPTTMERKISTSTNPIGEKDAAADESEANNLERTPTDIVYPSDLKLVLLMISMFVGMFLVALVSSRLLQEYISILCIRPS